MYPCVMDLQVYLTFIKFTTLLNPTCSDSDFITLEGTSVRMSAVIPLHLLTLKQLWVLFKVQ